MAGQVPLKNIADMIMQRYGKDLWGDFKVFRYPQRCPALLLPLLLLQCWREFITPSQTAAFVDAGHSARAVVSLRRRIVHPEVRQ